MQADNRVVRDYGQSALGSQPARTGAFAIDPDGAVPAVAERDRTPDPEVLRAHGYTVADLPAPWERLSDSPATSTPADGGSR